MTFSRSDGVKLTQDVLSGLGDEVAFFSKAAAQVAVGDQGRTIIALIERRSVFNDELGQAAGVRNVSTILMLDADLADELDVVSRGCSVRYGDKLYDIVLVVPDDPGAVECTLREFL